MDFIIDEAEVSDEIYSGNSSDTESLLGDDFIDKNCETNSVTFYRNFDNCQKFHNQQKDPSQEVDRDENLYFGENGQPEMFAPENINGVEFHDFPDYKKKAARFKQTLLCFPPEIEPNCFFSPVVYALSYLQKNEKPIDFLAAKNAIGPEKFLKLKEIEKEIMLDYTQFGFFD